MSFICHYVCVVCAIRYVSFSVYSVSFLWKSAFQFLYSHPEKRTNKKKKINLCSLISYGESRFTVWLFTSGQHARSHNFHHYSINNLIIIYFFRKEERLFTSSGTTTLAQIFRQICFIRIFLLVSEMYMVQIMLTYHATKHFLD